MVSIPSLWLPILLSAIIVFAVSAIIHMVLNYHRNEIKKLPAEDGILDAIRQAGPAPGDYMFPYCSGSKEMGSQEFIEKCNRGPVGLMTVLKSGPPKMGKSLVLWFIYCLIVGIFSAYISGRALSPGAHYLQVFRFAGCTAFIGYSLALMHNSIWFGRSWCTTFKHMFDGLVYGLLTAGTFGWLWPSM